jgi:hypothetical protein
MGDNVNANLNANTNANARVAPYVILLFHFWILLEFIVIGLDAICVSCLDVICSSVLLVCTTSLIYVLSTYFIYCLFVLNHMVNFSYFQQTKNDYRQMNPPGFTVAVRPPPFDGMHYKRWRMSILSIFSGSIT